MARPEPVRPELATTILIAGALVYTCLCGPAIGGPGYAPLDPFWYGVTILWPIGICASAFFDSSRFGNRWVQLIAYALFTAFIFGGTLIDRSTVGGINMFTGTFILGPIHVVIALLL